MQINSIRSMNFGCKECGQVPHEERMQNFKKDVLKANNDVNPLTCIAGVAAGIAALKGGSKAVGWIRSAAAKTAEEVSKSAVKLASKAKKSIDVNKAQKGIHEYFSKFTGTSNVNDAKLTSKVSDVVDSIFSKEVVENGVTKKVGKSKGFVELLNKNGIFLNKRSLIDNGIAAGAAYLAADVTSDVIEGQSDKEKIENSAKRNGINIGNLVKSATDYLTEQSI